MLEIIDNSEIKTVSEFRSMYANKWFRYVVVEKEEDCMYAPSSENLKSKVLAIADSKKELLDVPDQKYLDAGLTHFGLDWGINVNPEPGLHIGIDFPSTIIRVY